MRKLSRKSVVASSQQRNGNVADERHLVFPLSPELEYVVEPGIQRMDPVKAYFAQNGQDVIDLAAGMHE